MKRNEWKKWIGVVGRMLLAYALIFAQGAWATQNQATKDKAASPQKAAQQTSEKQSSAATTVKPQTAQIQGEESERSVAEEKPSGDGRHEGIKVHGHWTIEVRDPDGSVATHREFENSLLPAGANYLIGCLTAGCPAISTSWLLQIRNSSGTLNCTNANINCVFSATASVMGVALVLTGNVVSNSNSSVDIVVSTINSSTFAAFTQAVASTNNPNFSTPIPVSAGQTIAVTVAISFS